MLDITPIIGVILVCLVFPLVTTGVKYLTSKASKEKATEVSNLVQVAVNAAEQLYQSGQIKREERHDYVEKVLKSKGIDVNLDEIDALIENYVLWLPGEIKSTTEELEVNDDSNKTE